jgi:parallel beta-helix repeat protein
MKKSLRTIGTVCMLISALFIGLLILEEDTQVAGATLYVGGTGGGNYTKIQWAIDNASDGETVFVYNGTYLENVIVNKTITLMGEHWSNTTIDGQGIGDVVWVNRSWVNITGFTITNGGPGISEAGIQLITAPNAEISYCNVSGNLGDGIYLEMADNANIHNNTVSNNGESGIYLTSQSIFNKIADCNISGNSKGITLDSQSDQNIIANSNVSYSASQGIWMFGVSNTDILNSQVYNNTIDGIFLEMSAMSNIINCTIYNNGNGTIISLGSNDNVIMDCEIYSNTNFGITVAASSENNLLQNNSIHDNSFGIIMGMSPNNIMRDNVLVDNTYNFGVTGMAISQYIQDIDLTNTINGDPIYYLIGQTGMVIDETTPAGFVGLVSCDNIVVINQTITNNYQSLLVVNTTFSTITNLTLYDTLYGAQFSYQANSNELSELYIDNSVFNGLLLEDAHNNNISMSIFMNNEYAIRDASGSNNRIFQNDIINNQYGIDLDACSDNVIYNNNMVNNALQARDNGNNFWNEALPFGGNFWSDWTFPDSDCDGFVDNPYLIPGGSNQDNWPYTEQSGWFSGWFNKSAFSNYALSGMPDFDQREKAQRTGQNFWMTINAGSNGNLESAPMGDDIIVDPVPGANNISITPGLNHLLESTLGGDDTIEYAYCGPTAAANALWWLDSRFGDPFGTPGDGLDSFNLVTDFSPGDDHTPTNVPFLIEDLATRFNTHQNGDTNASSMVDGINQLLLFRGLASNFSVSNESFPDFPVVANEFEDCNAVILFLGFYDDEGTRVWGHIVTMSGVNQGAFKIGISDPIKNIANPIAIYSSYNDTINVSHDIYDVMMGPPHPSLPPPTWWLAPYPSGYGFPMPPIYWAVVEDVVYIKPTSATAPTAPLGLSAASGDSYVNLTWSPPADDGGSAIIGYNVYRDGAFLMFVAAGQEWYNNTPLTNGVTYEYNVTAVNAIGEGPNSNNVSATPQGVPEVPQSVQTDAGNKYVNLTWSPPANDGGSPILWYNIYRNGTVGVYDTIPAGQTWFNESNVSNGITYTYNVSAVNALGEGPRSGDVPATPMTVPEVVGNLQANVGSGYLNLTWDVPSDDGGSPVIEYHIYRNDSGGIPIIVLAGDTFYNDSSVFDGITYTYNVTAVNTVGEGPNSTISATPGIVTVPSEPQNLLADSGDGYANLTWDTPSSDGGSSIINYTVYRNDTAGPYAVLSGGQLWFNDTGVTNGESYTYNVSAINSIGESPNSTGVIADPLGAPSVPLNINIEAKTGEVNITWDAPALTGGSNITGYNIYKNGTLIDTVSFDQLWFNDTDVLNQTTYTYNISAVNAIGEGPVVTISGSPLSVPTEPLNLTAEAGDGYVHLTWEIPENNGSLDITAYYIFRNASAGIYATVFGTEVSFNDTNAKNGANYTYYIRAMNVIGESENSTNVTARPMNVPDVPGDFFGDHGDGYINLTWDAPFDGGAPITQYFIYRNGTSGPFVTLLPETLWFNDTDVVNGVTYTYFISANNSLGEGEQTDDLPVIAGGVPSRPLDLTLDVGDSQVTLTWTAPVADGGMPIINYRVYRALVLGDWEEIEPFTTSLTYMDNTVTNGITYFYAVTARNVVGESDYSQEKSGTPQGVPDEPTLLTAVGWNSYVIITWDEPFSDGGSPVTGYKLYRATSSNITDSELIHTGNVFFYNDSTVTNNVTYFYWVSAVTDDGEGLKAGSVNATPEPPEVPVNEIPTVSITKPISDVTVRKIVLFQGAAIDNDGEIEKVEIRVGDGPWIEVEGNTSWSHELDTRDYENGEHTIFARSWDGENYSSEKNVTIMINNPAPDSDKSLLEEPGFWAGFIVLILFVILLLFMFLKKRRPEKEIYEEEEEEEEPEEEEDEEPEEEEEE